jgi:hypothetical protein
MADGNDPQNPAEKNAGEFAAKYLTPNRKKKVYGKLGVLKGFFLTIKERKRRLS